MDVIVQGMLFRVLCMIIIALLPIKPNLQVFLIFLTDFIDCEYTKLFSKQTKICHTFQYQVLDKIVDIFTYMLVALLFNLHYYYYYLVFWRLIGVVLFAIFANSQWLIVFPDVFKEVWLYDTFIKKINATSFAIIYFAKNVFEYFWHTYQNKNNYIN